MRINSKQRLFGYPILKIRGILRLAMQEALWHQKQTLYERIAQMLECSSHDAAAVLNQLIEQDYVKLELTNLSGKAYFVLTATEIGRRIGVTRANPPITRQKATSLLDDLLERVKRVNANRDLAYQVKTVKVFGSYLSDLQLLGDVDVGIELARRYAGEQQARLEESRIQEAINCGRTFRTIIDRIAWPQEEVIRQLKTKKKGLNLHIEDEVMKVTVNSPIYP